MAETAKPEPLEQRAAVQKFAGRAKRVPAEQAEYFYNVTSTHKVFLVCSFAMLLSFIFMFFKDHARPWKPYQETFAAMDFEKLLDELSVQKKILDEKSARVQAFEKQTLAFLGQFRSTDPHGRKLSVTLFDPDAVENVPALSKAPGRKDLHVEVVGAKEKQKLRVRDLEKIRGEHYDKQQEFNTEKDKLGAVRYQYEEARHHLDEAVKKQDPHLPAAQKHYEEVKVEWDKVNAVVAEKKAAFDEIDKLNTFYDDFNGLLESQAVPGIWGKDRLSAEDHALILRIASDTKLSKEGQDVLAKLARAASRSPAEKDVLKRAQEIAKLSEAERKQLDAFNGRRVLEEDVLVLRKLGRDTRFSKEEADLLAELAKIDRVSEDERDALETVPQDAPGGRALLETLLQRPLSEIRKKKALVEKETEDRKRRFQSERPGLANTVRNLPGADFFGPTLKVQQVILSDVKDKLNFINIEKIDRCHTCHAGIGNPVYEVDIARSEDPQHEDRYTFKDPFLRRLVEHARGMRNEKTLEREKCEVCTERHSEVKEPRIPHGKWDDDDVQRFTKVSMAHPRLDLYVTSSSRHPIDRFGCTVCHEGDGRDTTFSRTVHIPDSVVEAKAWKRRHGTPYGEEHHNWNYRELWDQPMTPSKFIQASCRRCHSQEVELDGADKFVTAMRLYERAGCYACHRTDNYLILPKDVKNLEVDQNRKSRRPGPPFTRIATKVTEDWAWKWILAPRDFRPSTRMPHFFGQSNARRKVNGKPYAPEEIEGTISSSMVKYIWSLSEKAPEPAPPALKGDAKRGAQVVNQIGCSGCHKTEEVAYGPKDIRFLKEFGPNLAGVGSKMNRAWLYNWVINPKKHYPESQMPRFPLTEQQAVDVVEYLMTLRQPEWEKKAGPVAVNEKLLDDLLFEQLEKRMPRVDAERELKERSKDAEAKVRYFGRLMVKNYGCYSCHEMRKDEQQNMDWPNEEGIGVELTGSQPFGSKHYDRLDFGFAAIDGFTADKSVNHRGVTFKHGATGEDVHAHVRITRQDWLLAKLRNPRLFDGGKMDSKPQDELLKMPNFGFTEHEAETLATMVLSFTDHNVAGLVSGAQRQLDPDELALNRGNRIARENNCRACHRMSLDKLEVQWTRTDPVKNKEVSSYVWVEGRQIKKWKPDEAENHLKSWGFTGDLSGIELYSFAWAADHRTLLMPSAINPSNVFVARDGSAWWYLDTDKQGVRVKRKVRRHLDMDGGEILDHIVKYKRKLFDSSDEDPPGDLDDPGQREARLPPMLRTQGVKTQPEWLFSFLKDPKPIRPNLAPIAPGAKTMADLNVRMPNFDLTDEEAASLTRWFAARDHQQGVDVYPHTSFPERDEALLAKRKAIHEKAMGVIKDNSKGCQSCHYVNGTAPPGDPFKHAPELADIEKRLRPRWLYDWVAEPSKIYPGTTMTQFWTNFATDPHQMDEMRAAVEVFLNFKKLNSK